MIRIRFHGRGGHGVKTASRIAGAAAFLAGYQVQDCPVFGAERRGAAVTAFTRIDREPILERGVIEHPDLIIVADETLLADSGGGVLSGQGSTSALFVNAESAAGLAERYSILPKVIAWDISRRTRELLGQASALSAGLGAAAVRLAGGISQENLLSAVRDELEQLHLAPQIVARNVEVAIEVYQALSSVAFRSEPSVPAEAYSISEICPVQDEGPVRGAPSILAPGNASQRHTGSWRVERPEIDYDRCTRCGLCFVACPDGAISLDEHGYPVIDYDHCKGCMICRQECPLEAIGKVPEVRMVKTLLTGNAAAAWGARLAEVDYVPAFPITPQTEIIELLADWFTCGDVAGKLVTLDGEHSMIIAAGAAAATGVRTFTATSSQGLVFAMEALYTVAGWRVPLVLVNVSRALSAPITLGPDHNDVLAARDTGFVQLHAETCQEVLDSVLMAFRIAEDQRIMLPVLVNLDGFYLSFTREPVEVPDPELVRRFLPPFEPQHPVFRASQPIAHGVAAMEGSTYSYFRYQMQHAMCRVAEVHAEAARDFENLFGRRYGTIEGYQLDDAETVLVMAGSFATKGKAAVQRCRRQGRRVGLLRLRMVRPQPTADLVAALAGRKAVGVIDQNLSPGLGGILFHEIAGALAACRDRPAVWRSFIGGLGGKDISQAEFDHVLAKLDAAGPNDGPVEPELLFTRGEWEQVQARLTQAGKAPEKDVEQVVP